MALEIQEIDLRLRVCEDGGAPARRAAEAPRPRWRASGLEREALVEECVRRVLAALRGQEER